MSIGVEVKYKKRSPEKIIEIWREQVRRKNRPVMYRNLHKHNDARIYSYEHTHSNIRINSRAHTHMHKHTRTHTHFHTHTHTHPHSHTHTHMHTDPHTHTHAHTHTHTHLIRQSLLFPLDSLIYDSMLLSFYFHLPSLNSLHVFSLRCS